MNWHNFLLLPLNCYPSFFSLKTLFLELKVLASMILNKRQFALRGHVSEQPPCWIFSVNKAPNVSCTSNLSKTATIERLKKRKKPVKNCLLWRTLLIFYELAH